MVLPKATRKRAGRRALGLTALILALAVGVAMAATISGNGTLIGTNGPDTISAGNGNDTVYGLLGADTISAGNGNDVIDGQGRCMQGSGGYSTSWYCTHGHGPANQDGQGDTISAGNGDDTIYGGSSPNTISVGYGDDTIYGGPVHDTIAAGPKSGQGNDRIYLDYNDNGAYYKGSTVTVGMGNDTVYAHNGKPDTINCPAGNHTTVYADKIDSTKGCARVIYTTATAAARYGAAHTTTRTRRTRRHRAHHARKLTHRRTR